MLELYHTHNSVCAQKVRIVLAEKGLKWESHHLLLAKGEHQTPEYFKLNPKGVVPTLLDDGQVIRESTIIVENLNETYPEPALMPATSLDRAQARLWMKRIDDEIHEPATTTVSFSIALRHIFMEQGEEACEAWIDKIPTEMFRDRYRDMVRNGLESVDFRPALKIFKKLFTDLDEWLGAREWIAGSDYSLADLSYTPYLTRFERLNLIELIERYPNLFDWYGRMKSRRAYDIAIVQWDDPHYVGAMRENGIRAQAEVRRIFDEL